MKTESRRLRLTDDQSRRLAVKGHILGRRQLAAVAGIVTPDTILRWYRRLVAKKYDGSPTRRPGRPTTKPDIAGLIVRIATENPSWGWRLGEWTSAPRGSDASSSLLRNAARSAKPTSV
jgi:hypothetical protein